MKYTAMYGKNLHDRNGEEISLLTSVYFVHKTQLKFHISVVHAERQGNAHQINTAVSRKVVQPKSIKAHATIPKGMMGCGCSLLHRQVHEFSARWKAVL